MRRILRKGLQRFEVRKWHEIGPDHKPKQFFDASSARGFLLGFTRDHVTNMILRSILADCSGCGHLLRLDDHQVVEQLARQLTTGGLHMIELPCFVAASVSHEPMEEVEPPVFESRTETAPRPEPAAPAPSVAPGAAAQAATLRQAALSGAPFCET